MSHSSIPIPPIRTASNAPKICINNLTYTGILSLIFPIYFNSSKNSTITIGSVQAIRPRKIWFPKYSGKNIPTRATNPIYAKIPCIVGTGFLFCFWSSPGLSRTLIHLKSFNPQKAIRALSKKISR